MKTNTPISRSGLSTRPEQVGTGNRQRKDFQPRRKAATLRKRNRRAPADPAQPELFALVWRSSPDRPFRLRVGDVIRHEGRLCRVVRVTAAAAVLLMNRPFRAFTTRFDRPVRFQPAPALLRVSPNAETEILNP